jgi:hypothetical protein
MTLTSGSTPGQIFAEETHGSNEQRHSVILVLTPSSRKAMQVSILHNDIIQMSLITATSKKKSVTGV